MKLVCVDISGLILILIEINFYKMSDVEHLDNYKNLELYFNKFDTGGPICKILNTEWLHHGFQYKKGLNILIEPFNDNPLLSCIEGGLYVSNTDNIHKFYYFGDTIALIYFPKNNPELKIVHNPGGDKWRANMLIIGETYSLLDIDTYKKLGIEIDSDVLYKICKNGDIDILRNFVKRVSYEDMRKIYLFNITISNFILKHDDADLLDWFYKYYAHNDYRLDVFNKTIKLNMRMYKSPNCINWCKTNDVNIYWNRRGFYKSILTGFDDKFRKCAKLNLANGVKEFYSCYVSYNLFN